MANERTNLEVATERGITVGQIKLLQQNRGLTNEALSKISDSVLRKAVRRMNYPDMPWMREAFQLLYAKDAQGQIPDNALANALRQLDSVRSRVATKPRVAGIPTGHEVEVKALSKPMLLPTAGLKKTGWVSIGPGNIGGRTRSIVIHPTTPAILWVGSVGGGVWRTDDGGGHWVPVNDFMANLAVTCIVMDPTDPNVIYAGTGEGFSNLDSIRGAGIFRTIDGTIWQQLPSTAGADFQTINRLAISKNGKILLAATPNGIVRSDDPNRTTWQSVMSGRIGDLKFHPTSNTLAVAGGLDDGNAYYSTTGGKTWKAATHDGIWTGRVELTYATKDPSIVYASVQMNTGEIWRSNDGGKTYSRKKTQLADSQSATYLGDQGWYGNAIWAGDPTDENFVIVGGIDLWKSTDGGDTWIDISTWWDKRSSHADNHAIVSHPSYDGAINRTVFFGNDGGIFKTDDVTTVGNDADLPRVQGWIELNNTYGVTQFYAGAGNATTGTIIGGAQDNGTICYTEATGSEQWVPIFGGDGGWCAADPTDSNVFYGEYVFLNIHRNTDGGASEDIQGDRYISGQFWNQVRGDWDWKPIPFRIPDAMNRNALFIAPFILDPNEPNRILAGGLSLWRTNDSKTPNTPTSGPTWEAIKTVIGQKISAIAVALGNSDIIWVGHENGIVFSTLNGTANAPIWKRIDSMGENPLSAGRFCTRIAIDPKNAKNVFITFAGYSNNNVWRTTDAGANWHSIGGSLPAVPVRAVTIHPRKSTFVYLGTEVGVFASEDSGATWSPTNEGPTNCSVNDFFWMGETLVCATHGRGMFKIDLGV